MRNLSQNMVLYWTFLLPSPVCLAFTCFNQCFLKKVLTAFKGYLEEDDRYTILMTPRGYTIMEWDTSQQNWAGAEFCATPERMRDLLLEDLACYLEYKITLCGRSLEDSERQMIQQQVAEISEILQ